MATFDNNNLPFFERPDLSPFLVHLTRNTAKDDEYTAYQNLVSIIATGKIFGSTTASGFIKGKSPAACFMDVPLSSLKYVLNESNTDRKKPRYEAFGVVVTKRRAYKDGCRPVLYLSDDELKLLGIPKSELWRVVRLEAVDGTGDLPPDFRASLNLVESVSQEDGHEEAIHRRADHRLPQGSGGWHASQAAVPQARLQ